MTSVAVGRLPDGTPVIVTGNRMPRMWQLADGTPVIGGSMTQVWRLADGTPVGEPLSGHGDSSWVNAAAVGRLPDGTPVIVTGNDDGTVRVWRLADSAPIGEPLRGHTGRVNAVAAGELPDGTPVIVTGGNDCTVRVWQSADKTPLAPLHLPEPVQAVAIRGNVIVTATGVGIAVHQLALPSPHQQARQSDNGRLSGTTAQGCHGWAGVCPPTAARLAYVIRYIAPNYREAAPMS
jgi:WD40 repeat protein